MASNVQEFLDKINDDYVRIKKYYENIVLDDYLKDGGSVNKLINSLIKSSIRKQYKLNTEDLVFEFNLRGSNDSKGNAELGQNEFELIIPEVVPASHIEFTDGLPKERADKLIVLAEKYFAKENDKLIFENRRQNYIYLDIQFDFEKYRDRFIEQLQQVIDNALQNQKFEFETAKSAKGVVITIKPDYYNLDVAEDSLTKSSINFIRKTRIVYEDNSYLQFAADIIASMSSYVTGATSGRIKGDYELKIPVNYNANKVGYGIVREGEGLEIVARSLHDGFTNRSNSFTSHLERELSTYSSQLAFNDDGSYSWYYGRDRAEDVCDYASSRIAEFIEMYCDKNNIPVHTYADSKGLTITINQSDLTE